MKELLVRLSDLAVQKFGAEHAEVRAQRLSETRLTVKENRVEATRQGIEEGVALRVLVDGAWGFASVGSLEAAVLTDAVSDACRMAKAASLMMKTPIRIAEVKAEEAKFKVKTKNRPSEVCMNDKIKTALTVSKAILGVDKWVKSCTVDYLDVTGISYFVNSEGTYIEDDKIYVWLRATASAMSKGVFTFSREEIGSTAGYEMFDTQIPELIGEKVAKRAVEQLKARSPKGGVFPVVLGSNVVGVFVHEAFGHLAEADIALSGGLLANNLGKKIASDTVTFYDDGTINGAFGSFKYDDEGIPTQKTLLIKDGVVAGLMHNRETAAKFNVPPTGNARAEDFRVEPIIRMRNTFMAPKDYSLEELLEGISAGYYLKSFRGGQANIDGTFQVGIQEAYKIVKGEIGEPVRNASISGNTMETLVKVDAAGKEFELWPGRCGKGQTAFICDGGPPIRVKEVTVGGSA